VEDKSVNPVTDKIAPISALTGPHAKCALKSGERTNHFRQRLKTYLRNRREVKNAKNWISHPFPVCKGADKYCRQADHDKNDIGRVERRDGVGHYHPQHNGKLDFTGGPKTCAGGLCC